MTSVEDRPRFGPEFYEVSGRVMILLARCTSDLLGVARDVDWWESGEGGLIVEWQDGPYAHEVAEDLIRAADDPEMTDVLSPGAVCWDPDPRFAGHDRGGWAFLRVNGVAVQLRAMSPLGHAEASSRRPWATSRPSTT